jgi:hypothetical protein
VYNRANLALALGALAIQCSGLIAESQQATTNTSRLIVHVYDLANVNKLTMNTALDEASGILATTGVRIVWETGGSDSREARTLDMSADKIKDDQAPDERGYIVLRIVPRSPTTCLPGAIGFALPSARQGVHVTLFYDRIEGLAEKVSPGIAKILGNAMAHELGHVLLGPAHSRDGLMKAVWSRADYEDLTRKPLAFLPAEAVRMRKAVSRREVVLVSESQD